MKKIKIKEMKYHKIKKLEIFLIKNKISNNKNKLKLQFKKTSNN